MKTPSKKLDVPEAESQQLPEHAFNDNTDWEKSNSKMKRKLVILLSLAITLAAFLMSACDDEPEFCSGCANGLPTPTPAMPTTPTNPIAIRSIYPTDGAPGSQVTIILENFTDSNVDSHVTFGLSSAEIVYARYGMLNVLVPMDLRNGNYAVTVRSNGHIASAPSEFRVIQSTY